MQDFKKDLPVQKRRSERLKCSSKEKKTDNIISYTTDLLNISLEVVLVDFIMSVLR